MNVELDVIDGARIDRTVDGWRVTRVAMVSGLTGPLADRLSRAVQAPGIPQQIGEPHPTVQRVSLESVSALPHGPDSAMVTMTYTTRQFQVAATTVGGGGDQIEISASAEIVETNVDKDGKPLTVTYTDANNVVHKQTAKVMTRKVRPVVRITTSGVKASMKTIISILKASVGRITTIPGDNEEAWLTTLLTYRTFDGGQTWTISEDCEYDPDAWVATGVYVDPDTGLPPADVELGNGIFRFDVLKKANE